MNAQIDSRLARYSRAELKELHQALTTVSPSGRPDFSKLTERQRHHLMDIALELIETPSYVAGA